MADINITAAVTGAQQAGQQLDQLSAKTSKAAQATTQQTQALKQRNNELRRAVAAGAATGGGGRVGGMISGAIGLGGMGGMGVVGAGIGAGLAVIATTMAALSMALESSIGAIKAEAEARLKVGKAIAEGRKTEASGALAWGDQNGETRRQIIALGGEQLARQSDLAGKNLVGGAAGGVLMLARNGMADNNNISSMETAARTGVVTAQEAAAQIVDGARNMQQIISGALGRTVSGQEVEAMMQRAEGSKVGQQLLKIAGVRSGVDGLQRNRFESGLGLKAAKAEARAAEDPTGEALKKLVSEASSQSGYLEGIYDRMSKVEAFFDSILNRDQSIANQANRASRDLGAILDATAGAVH